MSLSVSLTRKLRLEHYEILNSRFALEHRHTDGPVVVHCVPELVRKGWGTDNEIARRGKNPRNACCVFWTRFETRWKNTDVWTWNLYAHPRKIDAAMSRIHARPDFEKARMWMNFFKYTGNLCENPIELSIPETFESGNKVLLSTRYSELTKQQQHCVENDDRVGWWCLTFEITSIDLLVLWCATVHSPMANMIVYRIG